MTASVGKRRVYASASTTGRSSDDAGTVVRAPASDRSRSVSTSSAGAALRTPATTSAADGDPSASAAPAITPPAMRATLSWSQLSATELDMASGGTSSLDDAQGSRAAQRVAGSRERRHHHDQREGGIRQRRDDAAEHHRGPGRADPDRHHGPRPDAVGEHARVDLQQELRDPVCRVGESDRAGRSGQPEHEPAERGDVDEPADVRREHRDEEQLEWPVAKGRPAEPVDRAAG